MLHALPSLRGFSRRENFSQSIELEMVFSELNLIGTAIL